MQLNSIFDEISANYLKYRTPKRLVLRRICQLVEEHHKTDARLLDLGCGVGNYLDAIGRDSGLDRVGLDRSFAMLTANSETKGSANLVQSDFCKGLPFQAESFQVVIAIDVLHFVNSLSSLLTEIRRILVPGGVFIAVIHTPEDIYKQTLSQYFAETANLELPQAQKLLMLAPCANEQGFEVLSTHQDTEQLEASKAFLELFEKKCASALHRISPSEYLIGIRKMLSDFSRRKLIGVESHTTYVLRRI
jgi:ubiquinone/menaquinone biosynthesis C-methylase UbiE